jgi:dCTP deaminase
MLLSDRDLLAEIDAGALGLDPFDASLIQPSSIDVRLDRYFRVFNNSRYTHIDPKVQQDDLTTLVEVDGEDAFVLHPGEFVLGSTFESVTLSDSLAGRLEGKSSLGRLGLLTHSTAGFIDPGFSGHITLELSNVANLPITLWPGMKIGQLCLFRLTSPALHPYGSAEYGSRYQGQRGPTPSRAHLNFRQDDTRRCSDRFRPALRRDAVEHDKEDTGRDWCGGFRQEALIDDDDYPGAVPARAGRFRRAGARRSRRPVDRRDTMCRVGCPDPGESPGR